MRNRFKDQGVIKVNMEYAKNRRGKLQSPVSKAIASINIAKQCRYKGKKAKYSQANANTQSELFIKKRIKTKLYPNIPHTSDTYGISEKPVAPNGKAIRSIHLKNLFLQLGSSVEYAKPTFSQYKSMVERFFGESTRLLNRNPSTTFANISMLNYDPAKGPLIDVHALRKFCAGISSTHITRTGIRPAIFQENTTNKSKVACND